VKAANDDVADDGGAQRCHRTLGRHICQGRAFDIVIAHRDEGSEPWNAERVHGKAVSRCCTTAAALSK
jgi:hypothetical protein